MSAASALHVGYVMHRRLRPRRHHLRYRIFSLLLDLDELPALDKRLRLFSRERFNLFSFREADYGFSPGQPLKAQIEALATQAGFAPDGGPVRVLTIPRILGYAFNPISVFFCHRRDGALEAVVCEVNNTFGERHAYVMGGPAAPGEPVRSACAKRFYVSPFMSMDMTYDFRIDPDPAGLVVGVRGSDGDGALIMAVHATKRVELSDGALLRALASHPLMMLKVIGGIHWEALKLWWKGVKLVERPKAPDIPVTIVRRSKS
jgi:DUF1365 family protein